MKRHIMNQAVEFDLQAAEAEGSMHDRADYENTVQETLRQDSLHQMQEREDVKNTRRKLHQRAHRFDDAEAGHIAYRR